MFRQRDVVAEQRILPRLGISSVARNVAVVTKEPTVTDSTRTPVMLNAETLPTAALEQPDHAPLEQSTVPRQAAKACAHTEALQVA